MEEHLDTDPAQIALRHRNNVFPAGIVSDRIKSLQKARKKLPTFYRHRCFFLPKAFEQCTSEAAASLKPTSGRLAIDLTCGLGVDTWHWAQQFDQVISLEPDPDLFRVVQFNFRRMGLQNVQLLNQRAEDFLASYHGPPADLIYADPDRRDSAGKRLHDPRAGSPDVFGLWEQLRAAGSTLLLKLSPMVEIREIDRMFPEVTRKIVLSVGGECKELLVECDLSSNQAPQPDELWIARGDHAWHLSLPSMPALQPGTVSPEEIRYLAEPDVAAYKAHQTSEFFQAGPWQNDWTMISGEGFWYASAQPQAVLPGRILEVAATMPFKPKEIKRWLKQQGIQRLDITRRDFPLSVAEIRKQLGVKEGGPWQLWCTTLNGQKTGVIGKELYGLAK